MHLGAALWMTGTLEEPDAKLQKLLMRAIKDFQSDPELSKPLGVYTWSTQLRALFKQDRLLQKEWEPEEAGLLFQALQSDEHLLSAWRRHLQLLGRLTNPPSHAVLDEEGDARCFFPPSDSQETRILRELFPEEGGKAPPEEFQLVDELIHRIRSRRLDTTPTPRSGWYDHQLHALVPFIMPLDMPEAERLLLGPLYRSELEQQFRGQLVLARETHIKQLHRPLIRVTGLGGAPVPKWQPLLLAPRLSIEPIAELYRRRAEGYAFLRQVLHELLGEEALTHARRALPTGTSQVPLLEELVRMEQLFRGAHAIVRKELGFGEVPPAMLPAAQVTQHWLNQWKEDPDLSQDPRCVVPLFRVCDDAGHQKLKVMAMLGFHFKDVSARFEQAPKFRVTDLDGRDVSSAEVVLTTVDHLSVTPVTAELYVDRVPDRAEFQALCDKHGSPDAILAALRG